MTSSPMEPEGTLVEKLSVLIPVYNEIRTLDNLLRRVLEVDLPCAREVIVVDDCSDDGSTEFLKKFASTHENVKVVFHEKNMGKGAAIRTAIEHVTGDWVIIQDADLEYDPAEFVTLLRPAQLGLADVVLGSRFVMGEYRRALYFWHSLANKFLTLVTNLVTGLNLTDMETCYKLIRADILKELNLRSSGFDIEPELVVKVARWGARIYEVPISYRGRTYMEGKKIVGKDAIYALLALLRYKFFDPRYCKHEGYLVLQAVEKSRRFNRWLFSQFQEFLGDEVLEAGCGIGNLTRYVVDKPRLVCIDTDDFYIRRLQQSLGNLANLTIRQADLTSREDMVHVTEDGLFDSVFCINVIEHIEDHIGALKNFREALKTGGRVIILVPHSPSLYTGVDRTLGHVRRYTKETLSEAMTEAGFTVIKCWGFNRVGGLGWRVSGKILRKTTLTTGQMRLFELLMPIIRVLEHIPFHKHNSLIAVAENLPSDTPPS